ncbi:MAG TPA: hypothetical protein VKB84_09525 [Candidatus Binataceae bacterium]|nr:hypothetical protein [Candidatus Binataceae bacterium]
MSGEAGKSAQPGPLAEWDEFLEMLRNSGRESVAMLWDPGDERMRLENYRYMLISLAQGFLMIFQTDPDYPDWVTFINQGFPNAGPNPDTIYWYSPIRADGTYRLSGTRGSVYYCDIQVAGGMLGMFDKPGPRLSGVDLDTIKIEADGSFELVLSKERPSGYGGNWHPLDPRAMDICVRQVSYDWLNEVDARIAIERLDVPAARPRVKKEQLGAKLKQLVRYVDVWGQFWLKYTRDLRASGVINRLEQMRIGENIGGLEEQYYYHGIYDIKPDEALIVETEVPKKCFYWNIHICDEQFLGVDWTNCQSSLNGNQALLDSDERFRAVVAMKDPGVPNWLDTAGFSSGQFMGRWLRSDSTPLPSVKKVPLADVRKHLPADTPEMSPQERDASLRLRRKGAQLRRRW